MALSNTLNEPRREMTETVIGVALVVGFISADYWFASWLVSGLQNRDDRILVTIISMIVSPFVLGILLSVLVAAHALGDAICNTLANANLDPRPKQRYLRRRG